MGELRGSDRALVAEQLGREPTTPFTVVARCPGGHPLVIRNAPVDAEGNPFPTLFWLTCPRATKAVSRLESEGAIARLGERFETDPAFARLRRTGDDMRRDPRLVGRRRPRVGRARRARRPGEGRSR